MLLFIPQGHILGLSHDGDLGAGNSCKKESGEGSVMAPMVIQLIGGVGGNGFCSGGCHLLLLPLVLLLRRGVSLQGAKMEI